MTRSVLSSIALALLARISPAATSPTHHPATAAANAPSPHAAAKTTKAGTDHPAAHGAPHVPPPPPPPPPKPASPLPFLPQVANVRLEVGRDYVLLTEEVRLPVGDYVSGDLRFFVSSGPVMPMAFDARLLFEAREIQGEIGGLNNAEWDPPTIELAPRVPASARLLLGRPQMAGTIVHVKEGAFRRAAASGTPLLVLRSVLLAPPADDHSIHEVVARLGAPEGAPITLAHIEVHGRDGVRIADASARLCGPHAVATPLAVVPPNSPQQSAIAPLYAVRHSDDDLCVFYSISP